jgi:hypothetical protein
LLEKLFYLFPIPPSKTEKINKTEIKKVGNNVSSSTENGSSENLSVVADSQTLHPKSLLHYRY